MWQRADRIGRNAASVLPAAVAAEMMTSSRGPAGRQSVPERRVATSIPGRKSSVARLAPDDRAANRVVRPPSASTLNHGVHQSRPQSLTAARSSSATPAPRAWRHSGAPQNPTVVRSSSTAAGVAGQSPSVSGSRWLVSNGVGGAGERGWGLVAWDGVGCCGRGLRPAGGVRGVCGSGL